MNRVKYRVLSASLRFVPKSAWLQTWDAAVFADNKARSKYGLLDISGSCHFGKCSKCVFPGCTHSCHVGEEYVSPIDESGDWKGLRQFAWVKRKNESAFLK